MELWQQLIVIVYGVMAFAGMITGYKACKHKNKAFEDTRVYAACMTAFVQADKVVIGLFWTVAAIIVLLLNDWLLFLLVLSVFWLVRSLGETIYWFFQQFTPRPGNDPQKFWHYKIFKNDSVWFINQLYWQCFTVVTTITTIYLTHLWLRSF